MRRPAGSPPRTPPRVRTRPNLAPLLLDAVRPGRVRCMPMPLPAETVQALIEARLHDPFEVLGLHREGAQLCARIWLRDAEAVSLVPRDGAPVALAKSSAEGL